ncbi:MAG: peptide chain release factor 2 [Thermoanaerobaculia bacterium]|nr:peptide chain release factor 2 [Thermoanaerobaculia bacterium]
MDTQELDRLAQRLDDLGGFFEGENVESELAELDKVMEDPSFWERPDENKAVLQKRAGLEKRLKVLTRLREDGDELATWRELASEDDSVEQDLAAFVTRLEQDLGALELQLKLSGPDDERNAIVAIHPGAGGTESQDWAEMLLRMYVRWAERQGFEVEILDRLDGDEAGIKSATMALRGSYAFGYLRSEIGVHRLVRISPFDAASRRHTSFASVYVYPEIDDDVEIEILDKDLRIDTYRSSGAGGQHVNVTDSAVRITHLPTNIVVTCQNERSQFKNRATAMKILRARLYDLEIQRRAEEQAEREGEKREIAWGSQIRSYVLHPYRMVKDHRTSVEVGDADRVLDGDLAPFIEAWLNEQMGAGA